MEVVRIRKHLTSDTLEISGLKSMAGKDVEIIILEDSGDGKGEGAVCKNGKRKPGSAKGMISISGDFHLPLEDEAVEEFYE